jgi:hypothetical protein
VSPWLIVLRLVFKAAPPVLEFFKTDEERRRERERAEVWGPVMFVFGVAFWACIIGGLYWLFTTSNHADNQSPRITAIPTSVEDTSPQVTVLPKTAYPPLQVEDTGRQAVQDAAESGQKTRIPTMLPSEAKPTEDSQTKFERLSTEHRPSNEDDVDADSRNKRTSPLGDISDVVAHPRSSSATLSKYPFHVSSGETSASPVDAEVDNAPRMAMRCSNSGQWLTGVGLFRIGGSIWIGTYDSLQIHEFYSYAAFRDNGSCQLFLIPGTFRVGQNRKLEFYRPLSLSIIEQACESRFQIFADTGMGIVDICMHR